MSAFTSVKSTPPSARHRLAQLCNHIDNPMSSRIRLLPGGRSEFLRASHHGTPASLSRRLPGPLPFSAQVQPFERSIGSTSTCHGSPASKSTTTSISGLPRRSMAMSTMAPTHGHSQPCCNVPPVIADGYQPKGASESLGGWDTYVSGPANAAKGLIVIYDIFGNFPQTLQGADILATGNHKVFMPDWLKDDACPPEWYPPDTEEKQQKLGSWFGKHMPHDIAAALPDFVRAAQAANPSITSWGIVGFCWGGKVVSLVTSGDSNPFAVAAVAHPAMVEADEASSIKVPYLLIASMEEPADTVRDFGQKLKVPHRIETFDDQVHGFMAARADLSDPRVKQAYATGYQITLDFLRERWL